MSCSANTRYVIPVTSAREVCRFRLPVPDAEYNA
jgi:hypothetical protein